MGVRFPSVASRTIVGPVPASSAEFIVALCPPLPIPGDNDSVLIHWYFTMTVGTGTTLLQVRVRRGVDTSGIALGGGGWIAAATAGNTSVVAGYFPDNPGAAGAVSYVLTMQQFTATAAGVLNDACLFAYAF